MFFTPISNMFSPSSESLAWIKIPTTQFESEPDSYYKLKIFNELFTELKKSLDIDAAFKFSYFSSKASVYTKHVFSKQLLSKANTSKIEEFLEWYVDTQNHQFMTLGLFLKVVVVPDATENIACLVLKKCCLNNNDLSYKTIKRVIDIPINVFQLIKSTDIDQYKLYSMVVLRRQLDFGDVHVDLDQIYDEYGESYCVQSIKASTTEEIDSFLIGYKYEIVYSKIYHTLVSYDNFLDLPPLFIPDFLNDYDLFESEFGHLIANENQFPNYHGDLKTEQELKEIEDSEIANMISLQEWEAETGLKNHLSRSCFYRSLE